MKRQPLSTEMIQWIQQPGVADQIRILTEDTPAGIDRAHIMRMNALLKQAEESGYINPADIPHTTHAPREDGVTPPRRKAGKPSYKVSGGMLGNVAFDALCIALIVLYIISMNILGAY